MNKPKISVIMAVYNTEKYLPSAIESILGQSYDNFEFIIIEDGSTDKSLEIIKSYKDQRIKLVENGKNMGHTYSLNCGLDLACGEYIARMDSDDISLPKRFAKQVKFMDLHREIAVCGTWVKTFGKGVNFTNRYLTDPEDIKANLLFYTSLAHPTVMIRKSVLNKHNLKYAIERDRDENTEDYGLWLKLAQLEKLTNIPEVLLLYRMHPDSVSSIHFHKNRNGSSLARLNQLNLLGLNPNTEELLAHNHTKFFGDMDISKFLNIREVWFEKIITANDRTGIYKKESLEKVIYERWHLVCTLNSSKGLTVWKKFRHSRLSKLGKNRMVTDSLRILLKSLLRI